MLRKSLTGGVMVLGTVLATGVATATPPYGVAILDNHARGQAVGSGVVTVTPGTGAYIGSYVLDSGSTAGWRSQPGLSLLAVTAGVLRVVQAKGCAGREYQAGQVAVLPAGALHVSNAGSAPAEFVGYFDNLRKNAGRPLTDGAEAKAPKGCAAGGSHRAASTGLAATDIATGRFVPVPQNSGQHNVAASQRLQVPEGGDIAMIAVTATPGTSTGWYRHVGGLAIITKGQLGVYEASDTGCAKVEESHAGEAVSHAHHDMHLSVAEGTEQFEGVLVYWGMGNAKASVPVGPVAGLANFVEANDFTPMPPAGCTTI